MTLATVLEILVQWALGSPVVRDALTKIATGHEDARKVLDVLPLRSKSAISARELSDADER
jgi:hypothetical protein